ncbi:MAG: TonB-dependent receptor plug domain-containing protein [Gemmatimonadaceae bacterium]
MRTSYTSLIGFAVASISAASAKAQEPDTTTLKTVVVSATKTPVARDQLTQAVTVISGDDLRAHGVARVSDALQQVPGITLAQNGSYGSVTSLFLRGGESRYTKVLIDGVAVNQSGGYFDFSHLTTDNVDRIEIVRGPASVIYGADAVTGVIQIFTKRGRGPFSADASARGGTFGTIDGDLSIRGSSSVVDYSLAGAEHKTDGTLKFNNQYSNGTLSGAVGVSPKSGTDARVTARYTNAEFHYPTDFTGAPVDSNSYRVQHRLTAGFDAGTLITPRVNARILAGTNEVSDLTEDIAIPFASTSQQHSADKSRAHRRSAEGRLSLVSGEAATLNLGAEYVAEGERSTTSRGPVGAPAALVSHFDADRHTSSAYAELLGSPKRFFGYTAAVRLDDNSDYGKHTTYRLGAGVPVLPDFRVRGSLSTAFNAPAFDQIRATAFTTSNPGLSPERSRSWEIGVERSVDDARARISGSYFAQRFDDLIEFVSGGPPSFIGSYDNLAQATSNGYEGELEITPTDFFSATASATVANPHITRVHAGASSGLQVGQALLRRPTRSGAASLRFAPPRYGSVTITGSYVGKRPDVDFNQFPSPTITLPAYVRVDAATEAGLWRGENGSSLSLTARIENLLDKRYETVLHYPAPGRAVLVGARFSGSL